MLRIVFASRPRVCLTAIRSGKCVVAVLLIGLLWLGLFRPSQVAGQEVRAVLFVAHPQTGQEATEDNPIPISANRATFEVRAREAGDIAKAGWQTVLLADACEFEQPAQADIELGDMFPLAIPVLQVQPIQGNQIRIKLGQVFLAGSTTRDSGRLATIHLTRKSSRSCPSGGDSGAAGPSAITFAASPSTQWSGPGGVKLPYATQPGYVASRASAVEVSEIAARSVVLPVPLLGVGALVALALLAGLLWFRSRSRAGE